MVKNGRIRQGPKRLSSGRASGGGNVRFEPNVTLYRGAANVRLAHLRLLDGLVQERPTGFFVDVVLGVELHMSPKLS